MAPREGQQVGKASSSPPNADEGSCHFWTRLGSLPIVQSTLDLYVSSKGKNELLGRGLGLIEYGVTVASDPVLKVVDKVPGAAKLDTLACSCLAKIETKVPAIHDQPLEMLKNVKGSARSAVQSSVRRVLRTSPGRQVIRGLDTMITWSEQKLDQVEARQQTEDGDEEAQPAEPGLIVKVGVVPTLDVYLRLLKMMKQVLATIAGLNTRPDSPRKALDGAPRRKGSPRKRPASTSVVQRLTVAAKGMLRLGGGDENSSAPTFAPVLATSSPRTISDKNSKPNADEVSESESEEETVNLEEALQNYLSDEDPDYVPPTDQPSADSLEFEEGDTESDIETETLSTSDKKGRKCQQIKVAASSKSPAVNDQKPTTVPAPQPSGVPPAKASSVDV